MRLTSRWIGRGESVDSQIIVAFEIGMRYIVLLCRIIITVNVRVRPKCLPTFCYKTLSDIITYLLSFKIIYRKIATKPGIVSIVKLSKRLSYVIG